MKNRSSSSGSANNSSTSSHGLLSSTSVTTTTTNANDTSFRTFDEYNDMNIESQGLLNNSIDMANHDNYNTSHFLPISILFLSSILLFCFGWYGPRYLMDRYIDEIIARNTPPYQIITTIDSRKPIIILDPTYNHPVIDPPTISCTFDENISLPVWLSSL